MSIHKSFGKAVAVALGVFALSLGSPADAKKAPAKKETKPAEATQLQEPLGIGPKALAWGMTQKEVAKVYDDVIDKDYLPRWEEVQPGVGMKQLENEIEAKKNEFRQSKVEFGELPTNLDGTAFTGEFTYRNGESMMSIDRKGFKRHLFFIKGKLWKTIDVYPYGEKGRYGKDLKAAIEKLEKALGAPGRQLDAKPEEGRTRTELDWQDAKTHLRAAAWTEKSFALIYEDRDTAGRIASLRTNKGEKKSELDPETKAALR